MTRDKGSRQLGQLTAPETPRDTIAEGTTRIPGGADGGDPRAIGELLNTWIDLKMGEVDALVDEAHRKVAAIPEMRVLASIVGEQFILLRALETEVAQLRAEVARLRLRGQAA